MKKRFSGPQIVAKLRQADVLIGQGKAVPEVCNEIEISRQTRYRSRFLQVVFKRFVFSRKFLLHK